MLRCASAHPELRRYQLCSYSSSQRRLLSTQAGGVTKRIHELFCFFCGLQRKKPPKRADGKKRAEGGK